MIERGSASGLREKVDCRKSISEKGPMKKVHRKRSMGEGSTKKVRRRRSIGEGS